MRTTFDMQQQRVVVIEDDDDIRDLMTLILEDEGYQVFAVGDGTAALDLVRQAQPDVVTLDLSLPGKDGVAILGEVKADPKTRNIPVLVVSAWSDFLQEAAVRQVFGILHKPFDVDRLLRQVAAATKQPMNGQGIQAA